LAAREDAARLANRSCFIYALARAREGGGNKVKGRRV
jgi:hypothetical protein